MADPVPPDHLVPPDHQAEELNLDEEEATAFEALERDFQEVLQELVADKSLEHFRVEYEKLHRAVKKSHESEKRLIKKCRELNADIISNSVKVQTALKLSQEDQSTITSLKKEVERAWTMVEVSHEKESKAKQTIANLKSEIGNLTKLVEQGQGLALNQEATVNNLIAQKEELQKHRDMLQENVGTLTSQNAALVAEYERVESEKAEGILEISSLRELTLSKKNELEREQRRTGRIAKDLSELKAHVTSQQEVLVDQNQTFDLQRERTALTEQQYKEQKRILEKLIVQQDLYKEDLASSERTLEDELHKKNEQTTKNVEFKKRIKKGNDELRICKQELEKSERNLADLKRKKRIDELKHKEVLEQKNIFIGDTKELVKEIDRIQAFAEKDDIRINQLLHERDLLNRAIIRCDEKSKREMERVKIYDAAAAKSKEEVDRWKKQVSLGLKRVEELDKLREKAGVELSIANHKYFQTLDVIKHSDNKIAELKKISQELRHKLNQQKDLYQLVRSDRNLYSRNLIESQDEIAEMKRKFKVMWYSQEQLKEEIKEKEEALKKESADFDKKKKECIKQKEEAGRGKKKQQQLTILAELENEEIKKLEHRIQEFESARLAQKRFYEQVVGERDMLATQLIRRNDELALLYEKIKIQYSTLRKGELCFKELEEEIRSLKIQHRAFIRECERNRAKGNSVDDTKRQIFQVQRELLQERTKVKALSEELENPLNLQRWRKLPGKDPAVFEMIQKCKSLQKRLITKTEQSVNCDLLLQEKEKLYLELQHILEKQPGAEIAAQVSAYQTYLKDITSQMKSVAAELNMNHAQISDYKDEIEKVNNELDEAKRKYFEQKRRNLLFSQMD